MLNKHRTIRTPSAARRIVVGLLVVAMTALALCVVTLSTAPPAAAASASWPTSWTTYTLANGNPVRDHTGDIPQEPDLGSGPCAGGGGGGGDCLGTSDTVYYASDGTNAFFRFRMSGDNNEASKGGYFGSAFIVRMYDAANTLKAVVGVNGKTSTADYVYVVNTDGNETVTPVNSTVYTYPWTGSNAGSRWISDGAGQYFLDIQVPITAIQNVWAQYTAGTPVKLYYGSSQAANLATINKDFMIAGDSTEAAMLASLASIAVVKVDNPVVTFDSQGGSAVATQTLTGATTTATQPTAPTRSGYAFNGWSDAASGGSAWSFGTAITADQTLYAQWTAAHTVTFDTHGGSAVADQAVTSGGTATQPAAPTRSGFSFNGWFTAASGGTAWNFASSTVTGATTIHAQWTADVVAQAITFAQPAAQEVGGTLTVAPTATSGLTVALTSSTTSVCTVSGFVITTLTTGTCTINANQAGNGSWSAAPQVSRSFALTTKAQTITFAQPGAKEVGDTFTPTPSASSGLTVSLTSTTTSVCTVSSGVVTTIATGTCTLAADQAGNGTWSAAPQVTQSLAVAKKSQTITFNPIADKEVGNTVTPTPSASSGLTVALTSTTPLVCTVASGTVTVVGAGTCTVAANQTGNGTWAAAFEVTQSFTATRVAQTITFNQPADTVIDGTFTPSPTASSNLAVALTSTTPSTCTVSSGAVTAVAAGTCTLAADQTGNGTYAAATTVTRSLIVAKKSQAITFDPIAGSTVGDTRSVAPTSSSGLTVAVTSATPSVCTVSGGTVTTTGTGTCTIHADQTGDATYAAASRVTRSFAVVAVAPVGLTAQTITFAQPSAGTIDDTFTPARPPTAASRSPSPRPRPACARSPPARSPCWPRAPARSPPTRPATAPTPQPPRSPAP